MDRLTLQQITGQHFRIPDVSWNLLNFTPCAETSRTGLAGFLINGDEETSTT